MAEFDDKLNSILSNPDAMAQIMQLAQSLSGGTGGNNAANAPPRPSRAVLLPAGASSRRLRRHPAAILSPPWPVGWIRSCSCGSCP